jgi:hypothetical protein
VCRIVDGITLLDRREVFLVPYGAICHILAEYLPKSDLTIDFMPLLLARRYGGPTTCHSWHCNMANIIFPWLCMFILSYFPLAFQGRLM